MNDRCERTVVLNHRWIITLTAGVIAAVAMFGETAESQGTYKSFQLVYHSDTRGYYRPCG